MGLSAASCERFVGKIEFIPFSECHYWTGHLNDQGYGVYSGHRAHRLAYELAKGPIPLINGKPAIIRHKCDNPGCVNPDHLEPGTQTDNMADAIERRRFCHGERHPDTKLSDTAVLAVIAACNRGEGTCAIAERFGISKSRVSELRHGRVGKLHPAFGRKMTGRSDRRISDAQAKEIYQRAHASEKRGELAQLFGVKPSFITDIKRGATYASVTGHRR